VNDLETGWTRRDLTDGERDELRATSERMRRFPPVLGLMTLMVGFVVARALAKGLAPLNVLLAAFGAVVLATAFRRWRRARELGERIRADAEAGWILREPPDGEGLEVLPTSRVRFTERGAAAAWREKVRRR
jgi:hypothetical protein